MLTNTNYKDINKSGFLPKPKRLFPLIRQISYRVSPLLAQTGISPNLITLIGLITGIASAFAFAQGNHFWGITAALLWAVCSLMDYCDGEVARITGKSSRIGKYLDDVTDWVVHTFFFMGIGFGAEVITGNRLWLWLGVIAAIGTTISSWTNCLREWNRHRSGEEEPRMPGEVILPNNPKENFIYVFRGLFRADFWLLIIFLELFHITWLLLPIFAIGTHVYWITGFVKGADRFVP